MASVQDLNAKVDALQVALDDEQAVITTAVTGLETTIQQLKDQIAANGTPEELDAIATKLDAITADLKTTLPEAPAV